MSGRPQNSRPTVRHLGHRLHQACNDNPIIYPYLQQYRLPALPVARSRHFVLSAINQSFHGRTVQPPTRSRTPTPPVYVAPLSDTTVRHIPTTPVQNTPIHVNLTQEARDLLANQQRQQQQRQPSQLALTQTPGGSASSGNSNQDLHLPTHPRCT